MPEDRILPIVQGDWVATKGFNARPQIGRVKQSWWDGDEVLMNIVLFGTAGDTIGRDSPAMDGPKTFEPAITFDDYWQRIAKPDFPLKAKDTSIPSDKPGWVTLVQTYYHDPRDGGLATKPVRTKVRKQSRDYNRGSRIVYVPQAPSNGAEVEAISLRRSAQELLDTARLVERSDGRTAHTLRNRAAELSAEAEKIMPRAG